jgi:hypothetical protein
VSVFGRPRQNRSLALRVTDWPSWYPVTTYGPLPTTGSSSALFSVPICSTRPAQTCSGTIGTSVARMDACGCVVVICTVRSSTAVTEAKFETAEPFASWAAGLLMIWS